MRFKMTSYSLTPFSRDGVEGVVVGPTPNAKYGKAATGEEEGVDAKVGGCVSEAGGEEAEGGRGFLVVSTDKLSITYTMTSVSFRPASLLLPSASCTISRFMSRMSTLRAR